MSADSALITVGFVEFSNSSQENLVGNLVNIVESAAFPGGEGLDVTFECFSEGSLCFSSLR